MGHLINPVGFRVGYFSNWLDLWSTSNNIVYAEILHNTVAFRRVMASFFENFVTDRYSILYSHFTFERVGFGALKLKMYFYDGIVEQKMAHLAQQLLRFKFKKLKTHRRAIRRFLIIKPIKCLRTRILRGWRYYDYLLARQIIFFFIYLLNMGIRNMTRSSYTNVVRYFYKVFHKEWRRILRKNPFLSVSAFVKYYIKFLTYNGFDKTSSRSPKLHLKGLTSDFSVFFRALDEAFYFWNKHQSVFYSILTSTKWLLRRKYAKLLNLFWAADRFSTFFFTSFFRLYLGAFRQPKFFGFMRFVLKQIFRPLGVLHTNVEFFGLDNDEVSAIFLARYLVRKIEMRFTIRELFTPIGREMKHLRRHTHGLRGYKFQFVGRLTRRGRVRTTWKLSGSIPTSKFSAQVEHSMYFGILRNGICCVRIWLYRPKSFGSFSKNFAHRVRTKS